MYKCINGWTKKKMIDHVVKTFKGRSVNSSGSCQYRGPNGKKCAIGMFMPNSFYKKDMDSFLGPYTSVATAYPEIHTLMPLETLGCQEMQRVHDSNSPEFYNPEFVNIFSIKRNDAEVLSDILNFIYAEVED